MVPEENSGPPKVVWAHETARAGHSTHTKGNTLKHLHKYLIAAVVSVALLFASGTLACRSTSAPPPQVESQATEVATLIQALAADPPSPTIALTCALADGRQYTAEIGAARRWSMFGGPAGPRAPDGQILGAHVVRWDVVSPDLVLVALRVSNAAANPDGSGHCGKVYCRSIAMSVDGWNVAFDVQRAPPPFLVAPRADGDNVFLSGQAFVRRFALFRGAATVQRALAALDSVPAFDIAAPFGPTQITLPAVDVRAQEIRFAAKLRSLRTNLAAGNIDPPNDVRTKTLGPFQPVGNAIAYEHGGQGIFFVWGWEQAPSAALFWRTIGDLVIERMRFVYDKASGARITPEMWAAGARQSFQPFSLYLHGDSDAVDTEGRHTYLPPCFDVPQFNAGKCAYEPPLAQIDAYDGAHRVRALGPWIATYARLRDPVAREALLDDANYCRMAYCDMGLPAGPWRSGLPTMRSWMKATLHQGVPSLGREYGWVMFGHAAALWAATPADAEYRALKRSGAALLQLRADASMPNGLPQRAHAGEISGAWEPKITGGAAVPKDRDLAQSFEQPIVWRGELALARYVPLPKDELERIARGASNLYANKAFAGTGPVPPKYVTVAKSGGASAPSITEGWNLPDTPFGDATHVDAMLAELYRATGEQRWLDILCRGKSRGDAARAFGTMIDKPTSGFEPAWAVEAAGVLAGANQ